MPKEHGSWGMFFLPLALGLIGARAVPLEAWLYIPSAVLLFFAREPFLEFWRLWRRGQPVTSRGRRALALLAGSAVVGAPLFWSHPWLIVFGSVAGAVLVWQGQAAMRGAARSLAGELIAVAASMLNAPATYYVATGRLDTRAAVLYALALTYFAGTVFYVKMRVRAAHAKLAAQAEGPRWQCLAYHGLLALMLVAAAGSGVISALAAVGYAPAIGRAFWYGFRPTRELNLKQIGWTEVLNSLVWLACQTGNSIP